MKYQIPGYGELEIETIILDLNGTLSVGGEIVEGVKDRAKKLKEQGYLMAHPNMPRRYVLKFSNNYLLRGVMIQLDKHGFLPVSANS